MLRVWGAGTPAPPWGSWASPLSPFSAPLPGIPLPPWCARRFLLPLARRSQHHQPVGPAPTFPCSPPRLSVHSYPQPRSSPLGPAPSHLDAGLQTVPAAAATTVSVAAAAAREGASQRKREGGREAAGLPSARLVPSSLSSPVPSPTLRSRTHCPRPLHASSRSRPAQGSHACRAPHYPGNRRGGPLAPAPCPSHAHLQGVSASQVPGPSRQRSPGVLAEAGAWVKQRGVCEGTGPVGASLGAEKGIGK